MLTSFRIAISLTLIFVFEVPQVYAYGSSQSSSHCDKPVFSEFQPSANKYLQSLNEFSFLSSSNTNANSLEVTVSAGPIKYHLTHNDLDINVQKSGRLEVSGKLPRPLEKGFARISITAHSKPGCEKTDGYLVRIQ